MSESRPGKASDDDKDAGIDRLIDSALDGAASPADLERLRELLRHDPAAIDAYVDQVRIHSLLQWRHGAAATPALPTMKPAEDETRGVRPTLRLSFNRKTLAIAAVLIICASLAAVIFWRGQPGGSNPVVALGSVTETRDIVWSKGQSPLAPGASLAASEVAIDSGTLRLQLSSEVAVSISGPARFKIESAMRLTATSGRITARVGPGGKGFTVASPSADVVDLGTEFGVNVDAGGRTDVVVFDGQVDLHRKATTHSPATSVLPTRMHKGEALHVNRAGDVARIVSVEGRPTSGEWAIPSGAVADRAAVISAVQDNLRDPAASPKYYRIVRGGLDDDAPAYVDRCYEWNALTSDGIPPELRGADLIMTFNSDKKSADLNITVTLSRPAALYVFLQESATPPDWLIRDFVKTPLRIGLDEGPPDMPHLTLGKGAGQSIDRPFTVWRRNVATAGPVILGDNAPVKSMYGIAAMALK